RWEIKAALGIAHDRLEMYEQAERRYRQALDLSPENAVVMNNLALSLAQAGRLDEAIDILDQASALPEATARMRQNLALLYAMKGDLASAEQYVRRDLLPKIADHNMAYYRRLKAAVTGDAGPAPPGPRKLAAQPMAPPPPPAKIVAAEAEPAKPDVKTTTRISEHRAEAKAKKTLNVASAEAKTAAKLDAPPHAAPEMTAKPTASPKPAPETMAAKPRKPPAKATALPRQDAAVAAMDAKPDAETDMAVKAAANLEPAPKPAATVNMAKPASRDAMKNETTADGAGEEAAPKVASLGGFRLQLGSFWSLDGANTMRDRIIADHGDILRGMELVVETVTVPERGDFFRVNSQSVPKRDGIDETCLKLAIRDVPCLLVRTP
ncbi:MAG: tetratricopeptide repeat protein, partial [Alphaproteobacteria bacterium]